MRYFHLKRCLLFLSAVMVLFMIAGCAISNNALNQRDLATCLTAYGVKIEYIAPLSPNILHADDAMEMGISGKRVASYHFNTDLKTQRERIANIKKNKFVYIMGLKFPAMVHGSYVLVNINPNPQKHKIITGFKNFHTRE